MNEILTASATAEYMVPSFIDEGKYHRAMDEMWQGINDCFERMDESDHDTEPCAAYYLSEATVRALIQSPSPDAVPLSEKTLLTVEEAAVYTGLGVNKIRKISDDSKCDFVLWNQANA